jgi:hypothetical protein
MVMGSWRWNRRLVRDSATAAARARAGAAYLDQRIGPEWVQLIDLQTLDIKRPQSCVCSQLARQGYLRHLLMTLAGCVDCGFSCGVLADMVVQVCRPPEVVRSYDLLNRAWRHVIGERRRQRARSGSIRSAAPLPVEGCDEREPALVGSA